MTLLFRKDSYFRYCVTHPMQAIKEKLYNLLNNKYADKFSDETYIKLKSLLCVGYKYDLKQPKTFNEKMNWLKLHDHNPQYTIMADKYLAKRFVADKIGERYVVPLIDSWKSSQEINFSSLPEKCVLKSNYNSGGIVFYRRGETDENKARNILDGKVERYNYYYQSREWPYKNIPKTIFAEQYIETNGAGIDDYKFWCFNGEPKIMYVTCKFRDVFENFYDMEFNPIFIDHGYPRHTPEFTKPEQFDDMVRCARILSKDIPFVRIDFFLANGQMYFGECTFFDWGGFRKFGGDWDEKLGQYLQIDYMC